MIVLDGTAASCYPMCVFTLFTACEEGGWHSWGGSWHQRPQRAAQLRWCLRPWGHRGWGGRGGLERHINELRRVCFRGCVSAYRSVYRAPPQKNLTLNDNVCGLYEHKKQEQEEEHECFDLCKQMCIRCHTQVCSCFTGGVLVNRPHADNAKPLSLYLALFLYNILPAAVSITQHTHTHPCLDYFLQPLPPWGAVYTCIHGPVFV